MFNFGIGFIGFGVMLWLMGKVPLIGARKQLTATSTIIGYKQFPQDKTITSNEIRKGANFRWLRVVTFKNPLTNEYIEMYSNPSVHTPEPIGTEIKITFDPNKTDPRNDFVWVKNGFHATNKVARISFITGLTSYVVLLFVPKDSPLQLILALPVGLTFMVACIVSLGKAPNQ